MPVTVNRQAAALRSGPSLNTEQFGKKITNMFEFGVLRYLPSLGSFVALYVLNLLLLGIVLHFSLHV